MSRSSPIPFNTFVSGKLASLGAIHSGLESRLQAISDYELEYWASEQSKLPQSDRRVSIVLVIYDLDISFARTSVMSVLEQTYADVELVVVDNGTTGTVRKLVDSAYRDYANVQVVRSAHHRFDPDLPDAQDPVVNYWNAGLLASSGSFVYFLSPDDILSVNYAQEMVRLFNANEFCTSAAPSVVSIQRDGSTDWSRTNYLRNHNLRSTYTPGAELARSYIQGGQLVKAPGGLMMHLRSNVLAAGGFDVCNDQTQFLKIAIVGESGFSPHATLYWRHHEHQASRLQARQGLVYYRNYSSIWSTYNLEQRLRVLDDKLLASEIRTYFDAKALESARDALADSLKNYGIRSGWLASRRVIQEVPPRRWLPILSVWLIAFPQGVAKRRLPAAYIRLRDLIRTRRSAPH